MSEPSSADENSPTFKTAVAATLQDIADLGVAPEDRQTVLRAGITYRLGGVTFASANGAAGSVAAQGGRPNQNLGSASDRGDLLDKISSKLKLDREVVEMVYADQDGELDYVLSGKKLPDNKAAAAKIIAQLVMGGRQAAGLDDEWTQYAVIRGVVLDFGKLDSGNFATQMGALPDKVCVISGKGADRKMKVTKGGWEDIAALITVLVGAS